MGAFGIYNEKYLWIGYPFGMQEHPNHKGLFKEGEYFLDTQ